MSPTFLRYVEEIRRTEKTFCNHWPWDAKSSGLRPGRLKSGVGLLMRTERTQQFLHMTLTWIPDDAGYEKADNLTRTARQKVIIIKEWMAKLSKT